MLTRLLGAVLILLVVLSNPPGVAAQDSEAEREVRTAVSTFFRAFQEADVSTLQTLLAPNYLHVNGRSGEVLNREQWLAWVASRRSEMDRGDFVYTSYKVEDLSLVIDGAAAVVTGITRAAGRRDGTAFAVAGRFTNLWIKRAGAWQRAGFHDSPLPPD